MNKDVEFKLKELYGRIHSGRCITLKDMVFLAQYDKECLDKTLNRLVHNDVPEEPKIAQLPYIVQNQENKTFFGRSIDERIAAFNDVKIEEDFAIGMNREEVLLLLCDERFPEHKESKESVQYTYFNSYEPTRLLNTQA